MTVTLILFCRSDSVAWNIHKMSGAGIQCSAFVVKEKVNITLIDLYRFYMISLKDGILFLQIIKIVHFDDTNMHRSHYLILRLVYFLKHALSLCLRLKYLKER